MAGQCYLLRSLSRPYLTRKPDQVPEGPSVRGAGLTIAGAPLRIS